MIRNILFVDNDAILSNAVTKSLAPYQESFAVVTASDGFAAVQQLKKLPVSLVIVELIMPRMDGMSLLAHLREQYPDIPAIIISPKDDAELQAIARAKGIIGYLRKPFQADKLIAAINSVLQREAAGGIMHDISPPVFLQLMEMDAKSCTIRIIDKASRQGGILYFYEGQLLDARVGATRGIEAAYEVFSWDSATIFMRNECEPRENLINSELTPIIMKAVGMKDEAEPSEDEDEDTAAAPPANHPGRQMTSSFAAAAIELLKNSLGEELGLKKCYQNTELTQAVLQLQEIGSHDRYGSFNFALINHQHHHQLILSGETPTTLDIVPHCPMGKIIQLLATVTKKNEPSA